MPRNKDDFISLEAVDAAMYGGAESIEDLFGATQQSPSSALVPQDDGSIQAGNFKLTRTGIPPGIEASKEEWQRLGTFLGALNQSLQWLIGDWVIYGEDVWGETREAIADLMGLDIKTIYDYVYVARAVHFSVRTENLTFGHHKLVAKYDTNKEQRQWLDYAIAEGLSVSALRKAIRSQQRIGQQQGFIEVFNQEMDGYERQKLDKARQQNLGARLHMANRYRVLADLIEAIND